VQVVQADIFLYTIQIYYHIWWSKEHVKFQSW